MALLLCIYRVAALLVWTLIMIAMTIPYHFTVWRGRIRISHLLRAWMRGSARILNLHVEIKGEVPDISSGLVVSNHLGYMDILAHGTVFPLRFTSTTVISRLPVLGNVIGVTHPVWVDRESRSASRKALRDFAKTMKKGMYLIVYPEGTSTDGKKGILPFKSTPFEAAAYGDLPVLPILTRYRESPEDPTVCWYGDMTLFPHLWHVLGLKSIQAELHFLEPIFPEGKDRKELAEYVHGVMSAAYADIVAKGDRL